MTLYQRNDIYSIVAGRQLDILGALKIDWNPDRPKQHIRCPYPAHTDAHPSWRWDHTQGRAFCTCGTADIFGVVMRVRGLGNGREGWQAAADFCRDALRLEPFKPALVITDKRSRAAPPPWERPIAAIFDYADEHGEVLFQSVKFSDGVEPRFMQRRPAERSGWTWNISGTRRILYRLPELIAAGGQMIYVVEGEKDVESLRALGLAATCNPMGAGKWRDEDSEMLRGADLVIIGDNDDPGRKHVEQVAAALHGIAGRVRVLDLTRVWPECPDKGDISDWIVAGGSADKLKAMVEALPDATSPRDRRTVVG